MKNTLMYYYNFLNPTIYKWNKSTYIKEQNNVYLVQNIYIEKELLEINELIKNNPKYYKIIPNKFNQLVTPYNNNKFILLKKSKINFNMLEEIFKSTEITPNKSNLIRNNWQFLWSNKIDYYEYQMAHIKGKYPFIDESIDYFIGLAETSIAYLNYNEQNNSNIYICHRRIHEDDFFNPTNIILDYKERDIGEYLKYIFLNKSYSKEKIDKIIYLSNKNNLDFYKIISRTIYPSYYFDLYDQIINQYMKDDILNDIIKRIDEFEKYINLIIINCNNYKTIKEIDWLK